MIETRDKYFYIGEIIMLFLLTIDDSSLRGNLVAAYHAYKDIAIHEAMKILNDFQASEDALHEGFIRFSKYVDIDFDIKCNKSKALLIIIVRNEAKRVYNKRKKMTVSDMSEFESVNRDDCSTNPEISYLNFERTREIANLLNQIKPEYADVMALKYVYQYSDTEISNMLKITEGNVRIRLMRAKKVLRQLIGGENNE